MFFLLFRLFFVSFYRVLTFYTGLPLAAAVGSVQGHGHGRPLAEENPLLARFSMLLLLLLLLLRVAPLLSCGSSEPHDRQGDGEQENLERKSIREQRQRGADAEQQQQQQQPRCLPADPSGPTARKKRAKREKETKQVAIAELLLPTTAAAAALERALAECGRRVRCCRSRKPRLFVSAFVAFFFSLREGSFRFSFAPFRNATGLAPSELAGQSAQQKKPHFFMGSVLERRPSAQNSWSGRNGRGENVEEPTRNTTSDTARVATLLACSEIGKLNTRHISAHVLIESRLEQHERRRK